MVWYQNFTNVLCFFCLQKPQKFAIMNIGAPACGMNSVVRSFVRLSLAQGFTVLGIHDSFDGLIYGRVSNIVAIVTHIYLHQCKYMYLNKLYMYIAVI